jgi:hypothetical protein
MNMNVTVYTPITLTIEESEIPALTAKARKRNRVPEDKQVPMRYIIEEARRAGLLNIGKDYCLDLETLSVNGRQRIGKGQGVRHYKKS